MIVVSSYIPFPNLSWWALAAACRTVYLDGEEHFQKMSYRNRYYITGGNGLITLSIPLADGREQRRAMRDVSISTAEDWQTRHLRTLVSVYNRTPFFEHYAPSLERLFNSSFQHLCVFNRRSIEWVKQQLSLSFEIHETDTFIKLYPPEYKDVRSLKPSVERIPLVNAIPYYQVFSERNGFLPNLSILDLLFTEGPHSLQWIRQNSGQHEWM